MTPPARQRILPYSCQQINEEDISAVATALRAPIITQGPLVKRFEDALCAYVKAEYCSVVSSGTAALHLAYAALGIGAGDEIITSPITFAATANAARYLGADVQFADVDPNSGNILPSSVTRLITRKTKAIVAVHLGGLPADMQQLRNLADDHDLYLIEDAAHALGSVYQDKLVGSGMADVTTFSFHPIKHVTTGEGGAVVTNDKSLKTRVDRLRHHSIERSPENFRSAPPGDWYYEINELGYNYRLTDFQCALGISQLKRAEQGVRRRREIASLYRRGLSFLSPAVQPQPILDDRNSAYHLFPVSINFEQFGVSKSETMKKLKHQGIGTQVHYIPVNEQPYYQRQYGACQRQPGVNHYYERTLSLPMYSALKNSDIDYIVKVLKDILEKSSKTVLSGMHNQFR